MNASSGLTLYMRAGCPFSAKVLIECALMGLSITEKNLKDPAVVDELIEKGGKAQTPYLVDETTGKAMYDSDAIIAYLHERFGEA